MNRMVCTMEYKYGHADFYRFIVLAKTYLFWHCSATIHSYKRIERSSIAVETYGNGNNIYACYFNAMIWLNR